ncbi:hypothetical protein BOMU111920_16905 [Bordetella muralis]
MPESSQYVDFYLGSSASEIELHTLQISQVSFSKIYRFQPYYRQGLWLRDEAGELQFFDWMPMRLEPLGDRGNLDFGLGVTFGDLGEVLPDEIERARTAGTLLKNPAVVIYRIYRSGDLEAPMYGPIRLQANLQRCDSMSRRTAPRGLLCGRSLVTPRAAPRFLGPRVLYKSICPGHIRSTRSPATRSRSTIQAL